MHLLGIVIFHKFETFSTMVGYIGFKENSTKIMERDDALIISRRTCLLFYCFLMAKKKGRKLHLKFLFTLGKGLPGKGKELEETTRINYKMSFIKDSFQ